MADTPEALAEMERALACLAVEVPGEVWDDVVAKVHAVTDALLARLAEAESDLLFQTRESQDRGRRLLDAEARLAEAEEMYREALGSARDLGIRLAEAEKDANVIAGEANAETVRRVRAEAQITTLKEGMEKDRVQAYAQGFQDGQTAKEAEIGYVFGGGDGS